MRTKLFILLLLLAVPTLQAGAQSRYRYYQRQRALSQRLQKLDEAYTARLDSLRDSLMADSATVARHEFAHRERLFMPTTFYEDVARRVFAIGGGASPADTMLLGQYLRWPQGIRLMRPSEVPVDDDDADKPLRHRVTLTDKVSSNPMETFSVPQLVYVSKPHFWSFGGEYNLQFMQNFVSSNWYKGGESSYSMLGGLTMQANFNNRQKVKWENKLELKYGLQTSRGDSLHNFKTTQDLIRLTSKFGLQAASKWYYTLQLLAYTQFSKQYKSNDPKVYSDFMSPFNLNLSLGMDYNVELFHKKLKGSIHLAPFAYNFRYVDRLDLSKKFGLDEGSHTLNDFGSECTVDLTWTFSDMIRWETRLYGYTTYERAEVEWENTVTFKFNRYISSQFFVYPRFDDGGDRDRHHGYLQLKEYFSLGFTYSF